MRTYEVEMVGEAIFVNVQANSFSEAVKVAEALNPAWHVVTVRPVDADESSPEAS